MVALIPEGIKWESKDSEEKPCFFVAILLWGASEISDNSRHLFLEFLRISIITSLLLIFSFNQLCYISLQIISYIMQRNKILVVFIQIASVHRKFDIELCWEINKRWCCTSWKSPINATPLYQVMVKFKRKS